MYAQALTVILALALSEASVRCLLDERGNSPVIILMIPRARAYSKQRHEASCATAEHIREVRQAQVTRYRDSTLQGTIFNLVRIAQMRPQSP